ncbi:unnamed protein product [Cunninghamella echinulata]
MELPNADDFEASALGTKDYWDTVYERENVNFKEIGDIGEIWFGEDSVERIIEWTLDHIEEKSTSVLDIGCGNGHLLLALGEEGYQDLTGIDYSPSAITLAKSVAIEKDQANIRYYTVDFLKDEEDNDSWRKKENNKLYQLVLDKGTFDAISLHPDQEVAKQEGRLGPRDIYVRSVYHLINKSNGILLITSCNWTMDELILHFKSYFKYQSHVKYPTFSFGGQTGSKICTVAFEPLPTPLEE